MHTIQIQEIWQTLTTYYVQVADGKLFRVPTVNFSRYDPDHGKVVASRAQIPLKLAYAVTCHRSQGLTLPACVVDCNDMHGPGMKNKRLL